MREIRQQSPVAYWWLANTKPMAPTPKSLG